MDCRRRFFPLFAALIMGLFLSTGLLAAQEGAEIIYAEGDWFTIVTVDGTRSSYEPGYDDVLGLSLNLGDTLLTEKDTYVELALSNSSSILKISESTTFKLETLNEGGGGVFNVAYGRIRAKVDKLSGEQDFWVTGYDTVAGIRGTDFGFDLAFDPEKPDSQKTTTVYCFEGTVEVVQQLNDPADFTGTDKRQDTKKSVLLGGNEMVVAQSGTPGDPLLKESLEKDIAEFWKEHDFEGNPSTAMFENLEKAPQTLEPAGSEESVISEERTGPEPPILTVDREKTPIDENLLEDLSMEKENIQKGGSLMISLGVGFITTGLISYMIDPDSNQSILQVFSAMGGTLALSGAGISLYSLTLE